MLDLKKIFEQKVDDIVKTEMSVQGRSKGEINIVQSRLTFLTWWDLLPLWVPEYHE